MRQYKMKEVIERVKSENGNREFSQKDLLWYLIGRVDELHNKLANQVTACSAQFLSKKTFYWFTGLLISIAIFIVALVRSILLK